MDNNLRLVVETDGTPFATEIKIGDLDIGQFCIGVKTEIKMNIPNTATIDVKLAAYNMEFHAKDIRMSLEGIQVIEAFLGAIRTANGYGKSYTDSGL